MNQLHSVNEDKWIKHETSEARTFWSQCERSVGLPEVFANSAGLHECGQALLKPSVVNFRPMTLLESLIQQLWGGVQAPFALGVLGEG